MQMKQRLQRGKYQVKCSEPAYSVMVMDFDCKAATCQQPNNPKLEDVNFWYP